MTDTSEQVSLAADHRGRRWAKYGWVLLTNWRKLAAAGFYVISAGLAANLAWKLACAADPGAPLFIPLIAALASWTIVALVRGFDGRFHAAAEEKLVRTPSERLVRHWLQATVAISILLLASTLVSKLNV